MKTISTFFFSIFVFNFAWAIIAAPNQLMDNPPENICQILTRHAQGLSVCSGTLIASNKILTAQHCIIPATISIDVNCGYQGFTLKKLFAELTPSKSFVFTKGVHFKESAHVTLVDANEQTDQSIMTLDRNLSITPMQIATPTFNRLACYGAGYGLSESHLRSLTLPDSIDLIATGRKLSAGFLNMAIFDSLEFLNGEITSQSNFVSTYKPKDSLKKEDVNPLASAILKKSMTAPMILPGDSGGPLFCANSKGELAVVGVLSTVAFDQEDKPNYLAPEPMDSKQSDTAHESELKNTYNLLPWHHTSSASTIDRDLINRHILRNSAIHSQK